MSRKMCICWSVRLIRLFGVVMVPGPMRQELLSPSKVKAATPRWSCPLQRPIQKRKAWKCGMYPVLWLRQNFMGGLKWNAWVKMRASSAAITFPNTVKSILGNWSPNVRWSRWTTVIQSRSGKDPTRRNEALDCRVFARAGAAIYGLDRISERGWQELESAIPTQTSEKVKTKKQPKFIQIQPTKVNDPWL